MTFALLLAAVILFIAAMIAALFFRQPYKVTIPMVLGSVLLFIAAGFI